MVESLLKSSGNFFFLLRQEKQPDPISPQGSFGQHLQLASSCSSFNSMLFVPLAFLPFPWEKCAPDRTAGSHSSCARPLWPVCRPGLWLPQSCCAAQLSDHKTC